MINTNVPHVSFKSGPCWHLFCIAGDCDGVHHVDVTGYPWRQAKGEVYCPVHDRYHPAEVCIHTAVEDNRRWREHQEKQ